MITVDNRADSVITVPNFTNVAFGLGKVNTDGKIGYFTVYLDNVKVDDVATTLFYKTPETQNRNFMYLDKAGVVGWSTAEKVQKSGRVFSADFKVEAYLANAESMKGPVTESADIDGSITLNFAFGI